MIFHQIKSLVKQSVWETHWYTSILRSSLAIRAKFLSTWANLPTPDNCSKSSNKLQWTTKGWDICAPDATWLIQTPPLPFSTPFKNLMFGIYFFPYQIFFSMLYTKFKKYFQLLNITLTWNKLCTSSPKWTSVNDFGAGAGKIQIMWGLYQFNKAGQKNSQHGGTIRLIVFCRYKECMNNIISLYNSCWLEGTIK